MSSLGQRTSRSVTQIPTIITALWICQLGVAEAGDTVWQDALEKPCAVEFFETALQDALDELGSLSEIVILLDSKALDELGLDSGELITLSLPEVTLREAIECVLKPLELDYAQRGRIVHVSTPNRLGHETRVYRLTFEMGTEKGTTPRAAGGPRGGPHFAEAGFRGRGTGRTVDQRRHTIVDLVTDTICPESWRQASDGGGRGTAVIYGDHLVVYQSPEVHRQTADLLRSLGIQVRRSTNATHGSAEDGKRTKDAEEAATPDPKDPLPEQTREENPFETRDDPFGTEADDDPFAEAAAVSEDPF